MSVLTTLIQTGETISLTDADIMNICFQQTVIFTYDELLKVNDLTELFVNTNNFVLFYQTTSKNIGHWVCVIYHKDQNVIELFDSYGLSDEQLLSYSETSEYLAQGIPYLTYLINKAQNDYGARYVWNNEQLQSADFGHINTCGRYAALRARFCNLSLDKFKSMIQDSKYGSDFLVTALTILFNENIDEIITDKVRGIIPLRNKIYKFKEFNL